MRLFIAVNINQHSKNLIDNKLELLQQEYNDCFKWVEKKNWHLTLKFIGDVSASEQQKLIQALKEINFNDKNKYIQFNRINAFPNLDAARTIYLAVNRGNKLLKNIHQNLENKLLEFGFKNDQKNFIPHLTLGRNKNQALKIKDKFRSKNFVNIYAQIKSISLYQSKLKASGPEYIELFSI